LLNPHSYTVVGVLAVGEGLGMDTVRKSNSSGRRRPVVEENFPPILKDRTERVQVFQLARSAVFEQHLPELVEGLEQNNHCALPSDRLRCISSNCIAAQHLQNVFNTAPVELSCAAVLDLTTLPSQPSLEKNIEVALRSLSNGHYSLKLPPSCSISTGSETSLPYLDGPAEDIIGNALRTYSSTSSEPVRE